MNIDIHNSKVLISALDWGLGHASRCIPLIKELQKNNCEITIAATEKQIAFYKSELNNVRFENINAYNVRYSNILPFSLIMFFQLPKIFISIYQEKKIVKKLIAKNSYDLIISDNRYGFRCKDIKSIFITHQLNIILPRSIQFFSKIINKLNKKLIEKFDECWIPDEEKNGISYELGHSNFPSVKTNYLGCLSRFENIEITNIKEKYDIVALVSGPEPSRTEWESILVSELEKASYSVLVLTGNPQASKALNVKNNITISNHIETKELYHYLKSAKLVISRSGYSSLMDYKSLSIKALVVPTKGQSEQEYLAIKCAENQIHYVLQQKDFKIERVVAFLQNNLITE